MIKNVLFLGLSELWDDLLRSIESYNHPGENENDQGIQEKLDIPGEKTNNQIILANDYPGEMISDQGVQEEHYNPGEKTNQRIILVNDYSGETTNNQGVHENNDDPGEKPNPLVLFGKRLKDSTKRGRFVFSPGSPGFSWAR